ncbi:hypothetical protein EVAR_47823_1 [Eumeta japonica]|uniref:Uncharacterized protein n=1 Tax=Eumeta variegata TaxID=151549 RepID=A0A4C1YV13_EUMVA|nr:hypothetical protein EVAR_47823_1 [Eumeta japonica]
MPHCSSCDILYGNESTTSSPYSVRPPSCAPINHARALKAFSAYKNRHNTVSYIFMKRPSDLVRTALIHHAPPGQELVCGWLSANTHYGRGTRPVSIDPRGRAAVTVLLWTVFSL